MSLLFCTGELMNAAARGTITLNGTPHSLLGVSYLADGRPSQPMRFSGLGASEAVIVDLSQIANGGFEADLDGWTVTTAGTGTVAITTTGGEFHGGTKAAKLTGGDSGCTISQTLSVRAGERRRFSCWVKLNDTGDIIRVRIKNNRTGRFLNSSFQWQATATFAFTHTGSTVFTELTCPYVVESLFAAGELEPPTLSITWSVGANDVGIVDDAGDWPGVDVMALIGVLVDDRCTVNWEDSDTGSGLSFSNSLLAGDHEAGFAVDQKPNLYLRRSGTPADRRYQRITFDNDTVTPVHPREIGELILCQAETLGRNADWGVQVRVMRDDDVVHQAANGDRQVYRRARWPRRALSMKWLFKTDDDEQRYRQARDEMWGRAGGGSHPLLLIPNHLQAPCYLVRLDDTWSARREFNTWQDNDLTFSELPFAATAL